ncbi:MAG: hypothetical protein AAF500_21720 [Myxococcota bacterium]
MARTTISFGILLIVVGVVAYIATGMVSVTALIPSFFGIALTGLGLLGRSERFHKPSLYGALVIAVLGLFGSASGIPQAVRYVAGEEIERPAASITRAIMALVLVALIVSLARAVRTARQG